jgi:hypothetical protein
MNVGIGGGAWKSGIRSRVTQSFYTAKSEIAHTL